jgi:hypothetical protein
VTARQRGDLPPEEADLLGLEFQTEEQEADEQRRFQEDQELRRAFLVGLMQNSLFREWLFAHITAFGAFANSFGAGPTGFPDPMATQFQLGMKAAGWALWESVDNVAPELASLMRREGLSKSA